MAFDLHTLKPASGSRRREKRIGRGNASGHGTYATRGLKGQRARSGGRRGLKKKGIRRILASLPKYGGFRSLREKPETVRLDLLTTRFRDGETVTLRALKGKGLVRTSARAAKIVGAAAPGKKIIIAGLTATSGATEAILKAGGTVK